MLNSSSDWPYVFAALIFFGYLAQNGFLWLHFYRNRGDRPETWKIQPSKSRAPGEKPWLHNVFLCVNLITASLWAFGCAEGCLRGWASMDFDPANATPTRILRDFIISFAIQSVAEYWWHRMMHLPVFYQTLHKHHHANKFPAPFDDMCIHPIEAMGYYCILYSPPFCFSCHKVAFFLYMAVMGVCGVLDHSGIHFAFCGVYDTTDHDRHHSHFNVNYSFPLPVMDILHGTYWGRFLGRDFPPRYPAKQR
jgi:sterol desaturase/sphingolipid hydroxylase (fatty acid hydroxylase superfamily)